MSGTTLTNAALLLTGPVPDVRKGLNSADPAPFVSNQAFFPPETGCVRFWLPWQWVQSTASEALGANPHWQVLDSSVTQAVARGMQVLITLRAVSSWGTLHPNSASAYPFTQPGSVPSDLLLVSGAPNESSYWKLFVQYVAQRYDSLAPGSVAFEIENEPNAANFWDGTMSDYTSLLSVTDYWLKQVAPQALVVAGALACDKAQPQNLPDLDRWQKAILVTTEANSGATPPPAYDVVAVHDYYLPGHWTTDPTWGWTDDGETGLTFSSYLKHIMSIERAAKITVPIWITETGFVAQATQTGSGLENPDSDPVLQATWLTNAFNQAYGYGVQRVFWLFAKDNPNAGIFQYMGLSDVTGTPRPAFTAFSEPPPFITLLDENSLFVGPALGMDQMPDQVTPVIHFGNGSYALFVTGVWDGFIPDPDLLVPSGGVVSRFTTTSLDSSNYSTVERGYFIPPPGPESPGGSSQQHGTLVRFPYPVLYPTGGPVDLPRGGKGGILRNDNDSHYNGMVAVFPIHGNLNTLIGFYMADQSLFGDGNEYPGAFYGQLCLARSTDGGGVWNKEGPTLIGEPLPQAPRFDSKTGSYIKGVNSLNQPTVIRVADYYYAFLGYSANGQWTAGVAGPQGIKVARAPIKADGRPDAWEWFVDNPSAPWSAPVLNHGYSPTMSAFFAKTVLTNGGMIGVTFNTYINRYLMTLTEGDGWYYSTLPATDLDVQDWSPPVKFFDIPAPGNWRDGYPTWENMVFVTPGAKNGETGQTGLIIFSYMAGWSTPGGQPREFDIEKFILNKDSL